MHRRNNQYGFEFQYFIHFSIDYDKLAVSAVSSGTGEERFRI